ncbi:MAG: HD domain-containing phosphohydrolase [Smithella sp.]|jgi:PAS domain S-box-containing protein
MKNIIVVDDEEQNRSYLQTLFQSQGFHVTIAVNGAEALDAARKNPPHIIISDILMPVMDGFMLCKEWKKDSLLKNIPFIFYTATYTDPKDEKLALDIGADLFVIKPQEPDILLDIVQKFTKKSKSEKGKEIKETETSAQSVLEEYNEVLFRKLENKIHQLEEANHTIKKSELKYRSIFQNSISGIFQISKEGELIVSNPALYRMLGYESLDELTASIKDIGKQAYLNQEDHHHLIDLLKQNNHVEDYETRLIKKDGTIIWIKANIWTIRDDHNHLLHYEGIVEDITDRIRKDEILKTSAEKLKSAMLGTINIVATIVEQRDPYTAGHQRRVSEISFAIAKELGLPPDQAEGIKFAGSIHDVGKIAIPSEILTKPTRLSDIERRMVEFHGEAGYNILKGIEFPWPIINAVHQHHERLNGSGYPLHLSKEHISLEAQIIAVADVVEAMASHRPYRPALGIDAALEEIEKNKGILYNEDIANACLNLFRKKNYKIPQ